MHEGAQRAYQKRLKGKVIILCMSPKSYALSVLFFAAGFSLVPMITVIGWFRISMTFRVEKGELKYVSAPQSMRVF
jgi:hypothetical protein